MRTLPLLLLLACADPPAPVAPKITGPCATLSAQTPGPLAEERAKAKGAPLAIARLHVREARLSGDPGFYTLANLALDCALSRDPADREAARLKAHVQLQFHRFSAVEAQARQLTSDPQAGWMDWMLLGDALMEQGELDSAGDAYQRALNLRPSIELYDRVAWLRWLWGDVQGAVEMQEMAVSAGSPLDPEPLAWVLTRLGWLHALTGKPAPEIDAALALLPDYKPARYARGRIRLTAGDMAGSADRRPHRRGELGALRDGAGERVGSHRRVRAHPGPPRICQLHHGQ